MKTLLFLFALVLTSLAFAQERVEIGGYRIPDEMWLTISPVLGLVIAWIASPITAIIKKRGGTTGNVTRVVHVVLSVLVTLGFGLSTGALAAGPNGWGPLVLSVVVAIIKGFGDYNRLVQSTQGGVRNEEPIASTTITGFSSGLSSSNAARTGLTKLEDQR